MKKLFHWDKSGIFEEPLTIGDLDHLFKAFLVDESESVVKLPLEMVDDPLGVKLGILMVEEPLQNDP